MALCRCVHVNMNVWFIQKHQSEWSQSETCVYTHAHMHAHAHTHTHTHTLYLINILGTTWEGEADWGCDRQWWHLQHSDSRPCTWCHLAWSGTTAGKNYSLCNIHDSYWFAFCIIVNTFLLYFYWWFYIRWHLAWFV